MGSTPINHPHINLLKMLITLKIISVNKNSIKRLSNFILFKIKNLSKTQIYVSNILNKKPNIKKFTVLKSPHVNKTAQEQFEIRSYEKTMEIYCYQNIFVLFLIKRFSNNLFKDVEIKTKISTSNTKALKLLKTNFNCNLHSLGKRDIVLDGYLKSLDCYGEVCFKIV